MIEGETGEDPKKSKISPDVGEKKKERKEETPIRSFQIWCPEKGGAEDGKTKRPLLGSWTRDLKKEL